MRRDSLSSITDGVGLALGGAGLALWYWKQDRLAELAAGSEIVTTNRGVVEVARRGSGYPVLVLHGDPGGYDQGLVFGEATFGDGFELIAPSRPGYLRTPLDDTGSPSQQAELLVALLDRLGVEETLVAGLSGGGPVSLHLAAEHPERVTGLVLGSAITTEIDEQMFETGNPLIAPIRVSTSALDVQSGLVAVLLRVAPDRVIAWTHGGMSTLEGEELEEYVASLTRTPEFRNRSLEAVRTVLPVSARIEGTRNDKHWFRTLPLVDYGSIQCPVLAVHGEYDDVVTVSHAEFVCETIQNATLHRVESDHLIWVGPGSDSAREAVRQFAQSVTGTLSEMGTEPVC